LARLRRGVGAAFSLSRCSARITPIRANIVGPSCSATSISACIAAYGWLQVKCHRCDTSASIPLEHVRRFAWYADLETWGGTEMPVMRYAPIQTPGPHMIKLTERREITPYAWVHFDDERWGTAKMNEAAYWGDLTEWSCNVRKHGDCRLGIAGAVKMLIRKIEKEESNHDGHCDSHERINS
jgi:hypothetical protein